MVLSTDITEPESDLEIWDSQEDTDGRTHLRLQKMIKTRSGLQFTSCW